MKVRTIYSLLCLALLMLLPRAVHADPCATYQSDYDNKKSVFDAAQDIHERLLVIGEIKHPYRDVDPRYKHLEAEYTANPEAFFQNVKNGMSVHPNIPSKTLSLLSGTLDSLEMAKISQAGKAASLAYLKTKAELKRAKKALEDCKGMSVDIVWCEQGSACQTPPGVENYPRAHYVYDCPDKIKNILNMKVDCPGTWWSCA